MLNGIGGRTIREAKQNMTHAETARWMLYMSRRGSLNTGLNLERGFAQVAVAVNRAAGGKMEMKDLMPHFVQEATLDDVMNMLRRKRTK